MKDVIYINFLFENKYPRYQIFKEMNNEVYYGRDHFLLWHTILVEDGSYMLEMVVPRQVLFVICDLAGNHLLVSNNCERRKELPLLRYYCLSEWNIIKDNYKVITENGFYLYQKNILKTNLAEWLLVSKKKFSSKSYIGISDEMWVTAYQEKSKEKEILRSFLYCGLEYEIYRVLIRHRVCCKMWYEYYSGNELVGFEQLNENE